MKSHTNDAPTPPGQVESQPETCGSQPRSPAELLRMLDEVERQTIRHNIALILRSRAVRR